MGAFLKEGAACPFCGEKPGSPQAQPDYIFRFGDRLKAEASDEDKVIDKVKEPNAP